VSPDGKKLLVANGKGLVPLPNPLAPQPGIKASATATQQYIGRLFKGSLSVIDLPARKERESTFAQWTQLAYRGSP